MNIQFVLKDGSVQPFQSLKMAAVIIAVLRVLSNK